MTATSRSCFCGNSRPISSERFFQSSEDENIVSVSVVTPSRL